MNEDSERLFPTRATCQLPIESYRSARLQHKEDLVAVEDPLEIRVIAESAGRRRCDSVAITMRTPGEDFELAAGFLCSEGVVRRSRDIWNIEHCEKAGGDPNDNVVDVHLAPSVDFEVERLSRHVMTTSACGICGRTSIEAVQQTCRDRPQGRFEVRLSILLQLTERLLEKQAAFAHTGGLHAAALFDSSGRLCEIREDVGRHNALDKMVGAFLLRDQLPLSEKVALVSGRLSFELVQKSVLAGIPVLAAVGAPSSLAVELAAAYGMTLIGFLGADRFNVYCGAERIESG